jgi:hypothetical protein
MPDDDGTAGHGQRSSDVVVVDATDESWICLQVDSMRLVMNFLELLSKWVTNNDCRLCSNNKDVSREKTSWVAFCFARVDSSLSSLLLPSSSSSLLSFNTVLLETFVDKTLDSHGNDSDHHLFFFPPSPFFLEFHATLLSHREYQRKLLQHHPYFHRVVLIPPQDQRPALQSFSYSLSLSLSLSLSSSSEKWLPSSSSFSLCLSHQWSLYIADQDDGCFGIPFSLRKENQDWRGKFMEHLSSLSLLSDVCVQQDRNYNSGGYGYGGHGRFQGNRYAPYYDLRWD